MEIVKELVQQAYERLEDLDFYESWTDSKVSTILEKLKNVENDISNLRDTIENSKVMPSLRTSYGNESIIPDTRDQWVNGDKLQREFVRTSNRTETNGDLIANEWTKFMETASNEEKIKALTDIIRTLVPGTSV